MDPLWVVSRCGDGTCCCIPHRSMIALISLISLIACLADLVTSETCTDCECEVTIQVESAKELLLTLFEMANLLLLLASIVESTFLVQLYVWYTMGFCLMGLLICIVDFLLKFKKQGYSCVLGFVTEVSFLFVIFRCLPLVDTYRKHIAGESSIIAS